MRKIHATSQKMQAVGFCVAKCSLVRFTTPPVLNVFFSLFFSSFLLVSQVGSIA
jgi:hypothetical protein